MIRNLRKWVALALSLAALGSLSPRAAFAEKRNAVTHPRTSFRQAFYNRHRRSYRVASTLHFGHSKLHDVLLLTPFERHAEEDAELYGEILAFMQNPPRIEPTMELYAPYAARVTWRLFRTIDAVHLLHEMTEDVMSDPDIPWNEKEAKLREAYEYYRKNYPDVVLSSAPLDVTMRRAAVMMKPYFTLTRNYYPKNNNFFYAAHWWHPAVYESFMIAGNDAEQEKTLDRMEDIFESEVIPDPPQRMLLSRELTPRYSRLSPETANTFDNLHMLHGITYDIFAYDDWTPEQKRAELYRVLDAMAPQPGDEAWIRKFALPEPDINPLDYSNPWVKAAEGAMTDMMLEMLDEMMPLMMARHHSDEQGERSGTHTDRSQHQGQGQPSEARGNGTSHQGEAHCCQHRSETHVRDMMAELRDQLKLKLTPGIQEGELPGSFADAMNALMPNAHQGHNGMGPGEINPVMVEAMLDGWHEKYGNIADVETISMAEEPSAAAYLNSLE